MTIDLSGRRPASTAIRAGFAGLALLLTLGLGACTTVEGTNAFTDVGTFEREVMTSTAQGLGLVPKSEKEDVNQPRGPLVLPRDAGALPAPQKETRTAALPEDSTRVQIDTSKLSDADIKRLRNARVVDARSSSGRPLTEAETQAMTARMKAANIDARTPGKRPLYLPPDKYFTTVGGTELICLAPSGELVALNDRQCPDSIRKALRSKSGPQAPVGGNPSVKTSNL